jgi:hypothetical protein
MMTRKIDFMPYGKVEEMCYKEAKVEGKVGFGKKVILHNPRDIPMEQVKYEIWNEKVRCGNPLPLYRYHYITKV